MTTPKYRKDPLAAAKKAFADRKWRAKAIKNIIYFFIVMGLALTVLTLTSS